MPIWAILCILVAGIIAGLIAPSRLGTVLGDATLYVFLPPLLFEAAWNLDARVMLENWRPIFALAVPGVAITTVVVGCALWIAGFALPAALIVGAIVSATDPIAIVAIFRRLPIPVALTTIIQSEALLNDATAVVLYRSLILAIAGSLGIGSLVAVAAIAAGSALGGIALGALAAVPLGYVLIGRNSAVIQIISTIGGAYASYYAAEGLHLSGIFAVIAFGITLREMERRSISIRSAQDVARFWDAAALFANACVFFLTGAVIEIARLGHVGYAAVAAVCGILAARFILAYVVAPLAIGKKTNRTWLHVVRAAGARGALSLALALALPVWIGLRQQIIELTFFIVIATLIGSAFIVPRSIKAFTGLAFQGKSRARSAITPPQ